MRRFVRLSEDPRGHIDKDPVLALDHDGVPWVAWHSYRPQADRIMARRLVGRRRGKLLEVSEVAGINSKPTITRSDDGVWVLWSAMRKGRWQILARPVREGSMGRVERLSENSSVEYVPCATTDSHGTVWAAWVSLREGRHQIVGNCCTGGRWSEPVALSHGKAEHFRPVLCADEEGAWLAYETAHKRDLFLRRWPPQGLGRSTKFSLTDLWEMFPRLCSDGEGGVWATWIAIRDVMDDRGIIDHKVEIMASYFDGRRWIPYRSPDHTKPPGYVGHLYDGYLGHRCYMGFVGRRRRPQIVREESGHVWVLYERKEDERHNRRGPDALLYGRPLMGAGRGRAFEIDQDVYHIVVSGDIPVASGSLPFAAQIPSGRHYADICAGALDLGQVRPVRERPASDWKRWKPAQLPKGKPARPRPTIRVGRKAYKLYWGDLHCHGTFSGDAEGEIDENYAYGRYKSQLDFMAVTDNDYLYDNALTPSEWAVLQAEAAHHNDPGRFLTFSAYERTCVEPGGPNHRIIVFPDDKGPLYRYSEPDADTLEKFVAQLQKTNAFVYAHHATWRLAPCSQLGGAEVCSSWDLYLPKVDNIPNSLREGYRLAFIGSSDTHRVVPGVGGSLMGIWAEELTREAIFEALWARRCFATNGERLVLDIRVNGARMGAEVAVRDCVSVTCRIQSPRVIEQVTLFRDGEATMQNSVWRRKASLVFEDRPVPGEHFYYVGVELKPLPRKPMRPHSGNLQVAQGDLAWSSPIWVELSGD